MTMLSHEEVMASIQAPSTFIPSKICSPSQDEEPMDVVTLSCDEIMSEPTTEIVATAGTGNETVFKTPPQPQSSRMQNFWQVIR
jgi:hypothetical protein